MPSHVISVSFIDVYLYKISNSMKLPNTIKELEFGKYWDNNNELLKIGDIPDSVTKLSLGNYNIGRIQKGILPNSITELNIRVDESKTKNVLKDFIPDSTKILNMKISCKISPRLNLASYKSIEKLKIEVFISSPIIKIKKNSLPPNLTDLIIIGYHDKIKSNLYLIV